MDVFSEKVYETLKRVPKGRVTTYKELAHGIGTKAYRAVGTVLSKNPYAPIVPCHRVVASDGKLGGFMGKKKGLTIEKKRKMLLEEGIEFAGEKVKDLEKILFKF